MNWYVGLRRAFAFGLSRRVACVDVVSGRWCTVTGVQAACMAGGSTVAVRMMTGGSMHAHRHAVGLP